MAFRSRTGVKNAAHEAPRPVGEKLPSSDLWVWPGTHFPPCRPLAFSPEQATAFSVAIEKSTANVADIHLFIGNPI